MTDAAPRAPVLPAAPINPPPPRRRGAAWAGKYRDSLAIGLKASLEYRANFFFSIASAVSPLVIQTALWIALYGGDPSARLFGFSFSQMIAYTVIAQLIGRLVRTGFEYDLNNDIRTGSLDRWLIKPIGYFGFRLCAFLGDKLMQSLFMVVLLAAAVAILGGALGFAVSPANVALFLAALLVAFGLNFLLFWCVGLSGFWLTEVGFLFEAVRIVIIAASGGIFPLEIFGPQAAGVLKALPFRFTIQFPAELLCGRVSPGELLPAFGLAVAWIVALALLGRLLWKRGLRRFSAMGS